MVDYIDLRLDVDASRTRRRLDWAPNRDRDVLGCIPTMIENMRMHPREWKLRSERRKARYRHAAVPRAGKVRQA
jgi:hypothetical protein